MKKPILKKENRRYCFMVCETYHKKPNYYFVMIDKKDETESKLLFSELDFAISSFHEHIKVYL